MRPDRSARRSRCLSARNTEGGTIANEQNLKPWPKGVSGNPKGRPKRKSIETLVEDELDAFVGSSGLQGREALAKLIVSQLLSKKNKDVLALYLKRAWPEISRHEVSADVEMRAEIDVAAEELRRLLERTE